MGATPRPAWSHQHCQASRVRSLLHRALVVAAGSENPGPYACVRLSFAQRLLRPGFRVHSRSSRHVFIVAASAASLLCCLKQRHVSIRPEQMVEGPGIIMMPYASSRVEGFRESSGLICPPTNGRVRDDLIGWQSKDQDPACVHDTLDDGIGPAALELRWRVMIPKDGQYEIAPSGFGLGAWGRIVSRGSSIGDYVSTATVGIDGGSEERRVGKEGRS